ncbi:MAG: hypothetical protein GKR91_14905 [Pseudomonadales bacterium]|nr:hypothetical protein [Pseudomonadales bacterium]
MTETRAKIISIGLMSVSILIAFIATFIEQNILNASISISGIFVFRYCLENPKVMMATSYKEFGELFDVSTGKVNLTGSPMFFLTMFLSILYIIVY